MLFPVFYRFLIASSYYLGALSPRAEQISIMHCGNNEVLMILLTLCVINSDRHCLRTFSFIKSIQSVEEDGHMSLDCPLFLILKRYKHHRCRYIRTMVGLCVKNGDKKLRSTFAGSTFPSAGSSFNGIARHHRGLLVITLNGEDAAVLEFLQSKSHNQSLKWKIKVLQSKSRNHLSSLPSFLLDLWHSWHAQRHVWLRWLEVLSKKKTKAHSLKDSLAFTAISSRLQLQAEQSLANWLKITASAQKKISSRFFSWFKISRPLYKSKISGTWALGLAAEETQGRKLRRLCTNNRETKYYTQT